ncbi:hypothetical protein V8G61_05795 [Gaetbulibacter sp. M240]|uniref:hypothetical protein n=1 Tax=Gaetbulibacter sp. M240 TaxID=3126511 RepID=UPI00374E4855
MKNYRILTLLLLIVLSLTHCKKAMIPPVKAPFDNVDKYAINDWWNYAAKVRGTKSMILDLEVPRDEVVCFGIYTTHKKVLKLTAQLFPLYPDETREVRLELKKDGNWIEVASQKVNDIGWSTTFRIENWDETNNVPYRLRHGENAVFEGLIRKDPINKNEISAALLSCNSNKDRGMREEFSRNINYLDPDVVFFVGDQSYDHKEHTAAWLLFGLQFREVFRNRPCVTMPDDHDIGQYNLWGEGGKKASSMTGDDGGYFFSPEYVKMVERCQTAHLPDPYDPIPVKQGIGVYYTNFLVGGIDFAIIEDRKFKSGPKGKIPQQGPRPDHIIDSNYDPKSIDLEGLTLLGERQLKFLQDWGQNYEGVAIKSVVSATGFCGGAHRHGKFENYLHADLDCNGWPQTGRNKALRLLADAGAVHLAGDQHLATLVQHGIDEYRDGPFAFVSPAIVNTIYRRWWHPLDEKSGNNKDPKNPLEFTGDYQDGLGNKITMHAYANVEGPEKLNDGFGFIRFNKKEKSVKFESWARFTDVTKKEAKEMEGWPRTIYRNDSDESMTWTIDTLK